MSISLLGRISENLLLPKDRLDYLIRSAPHRYKVYPVAKRSGPGVRIIAQPAREVKRLQYWVIKNIFPLFPIHNSATGYVLGRNILANATPHALHPYMLKLDFKDFFPSIKGCDFLDYAKDIKDLQLPSEDLERLSRILFWKPKLNPELQLSIGAPSSPYLSNAIMFEFDFRVTEYCSKHEIIYTRYADDMTFSMEKKELRGEAFREIKKILNELRYPRLKINKRKTVYGSKAHRRMVTGLILSNDGIVSLGRNRKRRIRAQIHHFINSKLSERERNYLRGMLAFARDIEPDFVRRMERKYGTGRINSI